MKPVISVCIFTFNHEKYIKHCIESVLMQKVEVDFEVILGEDYSADATRDICKEYARKFTDKIRLLDRGKNLGLCHNYYDTLRNAKGDYIAVIDGDDYWIDSSKLQLQYELLKSNVTFSFVFHQVIRLNELDSSQIDFFVKTIKKEYTIYDVINDWIAATGSLFFKASEMEYPEFLLDSPNFDLAMQIILLRNGTMAGYIDRPMSVYRINKGSNTNNLLYNHENTARRQILLFSEFDVYSNCKYSDQINKKVEKIKKGIRKKLFKRVYAEFKNKMKMLIEKIGYKIVIKKLEK